MNALRVKYQPKTFSQMYGVEAHIQLFSNIVNNQLSRPLMIIGQNGTGKSTLAEIILKRLICEHPNELDPCLKCDSCRTNSITATGFSGFSFSGDELTPNNVKDVILSFMHFPQYKFHCLIVDDLDYSSELSQKRLIRLINTHPTALVLFTVTEIQLINKPLFQRCLKLSLNNYQQKDLYKLTIYVAGKENIEIANDEAILALISKAKHNPRNILNILEKIKLIGKTICLEVLNSPEIKINLGEQFGNC